MIRSVVALGATAVVPGVPAGASAGIFGTNPISISGAGHANGESGSPAISGDNRKTR